MEPDSVESGEDYLLLLYSDHALRYHSSPWTVVANRPLYVRPPFARDLAVLVDAMLHAILSHGDRPHERHR